MYLSILNWYPCTLLSCMFSSHYDATLLCFVIYRHREELAARLEARERAFQEIQKKQQEELEALKKSQQEKNEAWAKKQKETDNLLDFLRAKATLQSQSQPDGS
uniref:Uncharacterized protein n=1 Tax=Aegilops tauschii subsp. strangulata TaxID=200361 RepID=A0A453SNS3_AEGTS